MRPLIALSFEKKQNPIDKYFIIVYFYIDIEVSIITLDWSCNLVRTGERKGCPYLWQRAGAHAEMRYGKR
jgi:hypothetical protein